MHRIVYNQISQYREEEYKNVLNTLYEYTEFRGEELEQKANYVINQKISKIEKIMQNGLDVGGISKHIILPDDLVTYNYDDGSYIFCFSVKIGKKRCCYPVAQYV